MRTGLAALAITTCAASAGAAPPSPTHAYPAGAFLVKVADKSGLQAALDMHRVVRLEPGSYDAITLHSRNELYGLPGTGIAKVTVAPGTTDAVLSTIATPELSFPPSTEVTRANLFRRIAYGTVTVRDARLEDNMFLDLDYEKLDVDVRATGWLRNNRFVRLRHQAPDPAIVFLGDPERSSYGNVFLFVNVLTQPDDAIAISDVGDMTFVATDIEAYATSGTKAVFHTGPMGPLRIHAFEGADFDFSMPIFDVAADELHLFHDSFAPTKATKQMVFRPTLTKALLVDVFDRSVDDRAASPFRLWALDTTARVRLDGAPLSGPLPAEAADTLRSMAIDPRRKGVPWERPSFTPPPDPAGPDWAKDLASKPDSSDDLQAKLDKDELVLLPAGTFHLGKSLRLGRHNGLIGAGASKTVLVAKRPDLDLIVGDGSGGPNVGLNLADLTLQGGRNGVHHEPGTAGVAAQFTSVFVSHVTFRDMTNAGIFIDKIFGWDNSMLDDVSFVRCGVGFQQTFDPTYPGGDAPNASYVDKVVFFHAQFLENQYGVDLDPRRAGNLNAWIDSVFARNTRAAARVHRNNNPIFANVDFLDNAGDPVVANEAGNLDFVSCRFRDEGRATTLIDWFANVEGSTFERSSASTATVLSSVSNPARPPRHVFAHSRIAMPLGPLRDAFLLDDIIEGAQVPATVTIAGAATAILTGSAAPKPQLLVGSDWGPAPMTDGGVGDGSKADAAVTDATVSDATTPPTPADGSEPAPTGDVEGACGCRVPQRVPSMTPFAWLVLALAIRARRRARGA